MNEWLRDLLFDPAPIVWVQRSIGLGRPEPFRVLGQLGTTWGVVLALGLALWLWGRRDAYALVGILILEAVLSLLLNQLFSVSRPSAPAVVKYEQVSIGSFPSGHVFLTTALWGLLYARRRVPGWLSGLVVLAVGVSRIYLGVHYLADVYGGALLGLLLVWAYRPLWSALENDLARWGSRVWAMLGLLMIGGAAAAVLLGVLGSNPFLWHSAGLVVGGVLALLLEFRFVRYAPAGDGAGPRAVMLALLGLVPLALVDRIAGETALWLGWVTIALGAIWALLIVPAWLSRPDGHAERMRSRPEGSNVPG